MEAIISYNFNMLVSILGPLLGLLVIVSTALNLLLATIQVQEQSLGVVIKLGIIFCFVYFSGYFVMDYLKDYLGLILEHFEHVGDHPAVFP
ncbi:MAG: flagellar biosynthetic protein FliQ [Deltaproteobacteria bacterium]|nr:flagellar biosynthetic protein FliQ [Deltaproteobacteria bacterium]